MYALAISSLSGSLPELLRRYAQGAIEFTRRVFPGNGRSQFHYFIFVVARTKPRKKIIADVASGYGHAVSILKRDSFGHLEEFAGRVVFECFNFCIGNTQLAAHGSVYVLSKLAAV